MHSTVDDIAKIVHRRNRAYCAVYPYFLLDKNRLSVDWGSQHPETPLATPMVVHNIHCEYKTELIAVTWPNVDECWSEAFGKDVRNQEAGMVCSKRSSLIQNSHTGGERTISLMTLRPAQSSYPELRTINEFVVVSCLLLLLLLLLLLFLLLLFQLLLLLCCFVKSHANLHYRIISRIIWTCRRYCLTHFVIYIYWLLMQCGFPVGCTAATTGLCQHDACVLFISLLGDDAASFSICTCRPHGVPDSYCHRTDVGRNGSWDVSWKWDVSVLQIKWNLLNNKGPKATDMLLKQWLKRQTYYV